MERIGFQRGMDTLLETDMNIKELVTDGHTEISALMKNCDKYKEIKHQRDVWHGGKGVTKKVITVSVSKENEDLSLWVSAIRNHFWYCSRECGGSAQTFKELWIGILHHIVNEHEWLLTGGDEGGKCGHGALTDEDRKKPWLKKNSAPHKALREIILNKRFLNTLPYYTNFRHTGFLESFHNHLLMYVPKRHSYSFVGYKVRNQLAAIDFNKHTDREVATTADGQPIFCAKYSKRTKQWRPVNVLKPKPYAYIPDLMELVYERRRNVEGPVDQRLGLSAEGPKKHCQEYFSNPTPKYGNTYPEQPITVCQISI